jgi:branched-chain amino acid aminotransferase
MTTWCNGHFAEQLMLAPNERGLMLGDGIFETIAVRHGKPIWLEDHLVRLETSAADLGLPCDMATIRQGLEAVLQQSAAAAEVLRLTLTRGPTPRGLAVDGANPSLFITLNPFELSKLPSSVRLATSSIRRNPTSPASNHKTLSYIDAIAAAREVATRADDALLLNTGGMVACTTIANIFALKGNHLITPSRDQGILFGMARARLIAGVAQLSLVIEERQMAPEELYAADAIFLTNSLRLATRVASLDGKSCGTRDFTFINTYLEETFT